LDKAGLAHVTQHITAMTIANFMLAALVIFVFIALAVSYFLVELEFRFISLSL
jgi:uncharacterized membrane protein YjgN (DUF898 family)